MFVTVLTCALLMQGVFGNPFWEEVVERSSLAAPRTFNNFQESNWNPVNWFGKDSHPDKNEVKFEALFKAIDCLTKNVPKDCTKVIDEAKALFDKPKKTAHKPKPDASNIKDQSVMS